MVTDGYYSRNNVKILFFIHTTRINKKDAFLNDHFSHFVIDFKLNALHHWKGPFINFQDQKEKVLNLKLEI